MVSEQADRPEPVLWFSNCHWHCQQPPSPTGTLKTIVSLDITTSKQVPGQKHQQKCTCHTNVHAHCSFYTKAEFSILNNI